MQTLFKRAAATAAALVAIGSATGLPVASADTARPATSQSHSFWCGGYWDHCCYGGYGYGGWWHHRWCHPYYEDHGLGLGLGLR
jgi:hypothetical protein